MDRAVHFVGFRGAEYVSALNVWGKPDFYHMTWDRRARREIMDGDTIVFAKGPADQQFGDRNSPDIIEPKED